MNSTAFAGAPLPGAGRAARRTLRHASTPRQQHARTPRQPALAPRMQEAGLGGLLRRRHLDRGGSLVLPSSDSYCACESGRTYGNCCRIQHVAARLPRRAEEVLRARYSAYAATLPAYIMRTTATIECEFDRRKWRAKILDFAGRYQFDGGVDILETNMTGPEETVIIFRANMSERGEEVSFVERSKWVLNKGMWEYAGGKLVEVEDEMFA